MRKPWKRRKSYPWLRADDLVETVSEWTGISRDALLNTRCRNNPTIKAKRLLAASLGVGLGISKQAIGKEMGYVTHHGGKSVDHLLALADPSEVAAIVNLAKDRRRV